MESTTLISKPATGILPTIAEHLQADPNDIGNFLSVAVRVLRQRQLERNDVQEMLRQIAERKGVAR